MMKESQFKQKFFSSSIEICLDTITYLSQSNFSQLLKLKKKKDPQNEEK